MNFRSLGSTAAAPAATTAHDPVATTDDHCVPPVEPSLNEFLPEYLES